MKAGNNLGVVIPAGGLVGGRALPTRKWLAPTLLILLLLLLALSARAGTRLAIIADDRGTCVRAVPIVVGACSRLLPGTVIGYMPARKSSSGTVLLSIPSRYTSGTGCAGMIERFPTVGCAGMCCRCRLDLCRGIAGWWQWAASRSRR